MDPGHDSVAFWEALDRQSFTVQRCRQCHGAQWYPRAVCRHCQSRDVELDDNEGGGTLVAVTTIHRAASAEFRDAVPYALGIIELDAGPRVLAPLTASAPIGARMVAVPQVRPFPDAVCAFSEVPGDQARP